IYISGMTMGDLDGANAGNYDVFVAKYSDAALAGDYDNDGDVDAADYQAWRQAFGSSGNPLAADGNKDGTVDAADYVMWRNRYGAPAMGSLAAIPEPSSVALMILAAVAAVKLRF